MRSIAAALTAVVVAMSITVAGAEAAPKRPTTTQPVYVALGDSYAAGDGAGSYLRDRTTCYRSLKGYPGLIAAENGYALDLQACSGATTSDVLNLQIPSNKLSRSTQFVTITVGGKDIGFSVVVSTCMGTSEDACLAAVGKAVDLTEQVLPRRLDQVFAAAKSKAPNATIVATTYPRLMPPETSCTSWLTNFTATETAAMNAGADVLAEVITTSAESQGIGVADVRDPVAGHAVCDPQAWIHDANLLNQHESFHPTATGYASGYKPTVAGVLGGTATGTAATVTTGGTTSSDTTRGAVKLPKN